MNEKEFRKKILTLQHRMYAMALRIGLPPEDAADAVQETQLRLWRARHGLPDSPEAMTAYCFATLRNQSISILRQRKPTVQIEDIHHSIPSGPQDPMDSDTRTHLDLLIGRLPENQQKVLRLKSFAEMEYPEIEELTGLSVGNIRQLISRARKNLRDMLGKT